MSLIYLLSSLPMLAFDSAPGVTPEAFMEACREQISTSDANTVEALLQGKPTAHAFAAAYQDSEAQLRNAIARERARRLKKPDPERWTHPTLEYNPMLESQVANAFLEPNPQAREKALDKIRWRTVEYLQGCDTLGFNSLLAYALKLSLASRWTQLDVKRGHTVFDTLTDIPFKLSLTQDEASHTDTE